MPRTLVYPLPGQFQGKPLAISVLGWASSWRFISEAVAYQHDVTPEDVDCIDAYWGGPNDDDNSCDLLIVNGEFAGSFDRALSADDWAAIRNCTDNQTRARAA